jgi:hypothetical protein
MDIQSTTNNIPEKILLKKQSLVKLIASAQKSNNAAFRVFTLRFAARFFHSLGDAETVHDLLTAADKICPRELPDYKKLQDDMAKYGIKSRLKKVRPPSIPVQHFDIANSISEDLFQYIKRLNLSIWILFKNGAVLCCHHNDTAINSELISAFFTALQNFSEEYGDGPLQAIMLRNFRYNFVLKEPRPITLICRTPIHFDQEELQPFLTEIYNEFWRRFEPILNESFAGNVGPFRHFFTP